MRWILAAALAAILPTQVGAERRPILRDSVALNIGVSCQWQARCIAQQRRAMNNALRYVIARRPAQWRVQLCNRNAGRGGDRVDWIGFDHCIRNHHLAPAMHAAKARSRH